MIRHRTVLTAALFLIAVAPGVVWGQESSDSSDESAEATPEPVRSSETVGGYTDGLLTELQSRDPERRLAAVRALGQRRGRTIIRALAWTLENDPMPEIRIEAAQALARYGTTARDALQQAGSSDANAQVRRIAATLANGISPQPRSNRAVGNQPSNAAPVAQRRDVEIPPDDVDGLARASRRLRVSGWTVFALSWLGTFVEAIFVMANFYSMDPEVGWMGMLPIFGPAMMVANGEMTEEGLGIVNLLAFTAQVSGLVVALAGHRLRHPERGRVTRLGRNRGPGENRHDRRDRRRRGSKNWGLTVAPTGSGVSIAGWFR